MEWSRKAVSIYFQRRGINLKRERATMKDIFCTDVNNFQTNEMKCMCFAVQPCNEWSWSSGERGKVSYRSTWNIWLQH